MGKAVAAIENGAGGFLQTSAVNLLKSISITVDLNPGDRDTLSAFLATSNGQSSEYAPASGEITGILKQMKEDFETDLADVQKDEGQGVENYKGYMAELEKNIELAKKKLGTHKRAKSKREEMAGVLRKRK